MILAAAFIADLIAVTPTAMFAAHYAAIVKRTSRLRQLIRMAQHLAELSYDEAADPDAIGVRLSRGVNDFLRPIAQRAEVNLHGAMEEEMDRLARMVEANRTGEEYGMNIGCALDHILGGLHPSNVFVLAARPGVGKSSWAVWAAIKLAEQGFAGVFFSLEMSRSEVVRKVISHYAQVDSMALRSGVLDDDQWNRTIEALNPTGLLPLSIVDKGCNTVTEIRNHLRQLPDQFRPRFIVVDYVQLMSTSRDDNISQNESRQGALEYIMQTLKAIAKEFDLVVIAVSQLSRAVELRADKRPMLSDLRSSGAIEQAGDYVLFLYRESQYRRGEDKETDSDGYSDDGITEVIVRKNRHGKTGSVKMHFNMPFNTYADVVSERIVDDGRPTEFAIPSAMPSAAQVEFWNQD